MSRLAGVTAILLLAWTAGAGAEPHIAARAGYKCMVCHVNTSGGGLRTDFGIGYAQTEMAAEAVTLGSQRWADSLESFLNVGGDLRTVASHTDVPDETERSAFETRELRLYLAADLIPDRLLAYVDQRVAPGGSSNREAYVRLAFGDQKYFLKAGRMYLPYGLRLEDDTAFIRQVPGINFDTPDDGVELGLEQGPWTVQLAVSNGTAGGPELDQGKQLSLRGAYVHGLWRLGGSVNHNHTAAGDRNMQNLFATLRTGPLVWLAEVDTIDDETFATGRRRQWAGLAEVNWFWRQGSNFKLTVEFLDPDTDVDEDERNRYSLVYEYTPFKFLQLRPGLRIYDGIPQNELQNRRLAFVELHAFF